MTVDLKKINSSEGIQVTAASDIRVTADALKVFVDDAAYVTAMGTAANGDMYYNSTTNKVRVYRSGSWENMHPGDFIGARYKISTSTKNTVLADNVYEVIDYDTSEYDTTGGWVTTDTGSAPTGNQDWKITAGADGYLDISANVLINNANITQGSNPDLAIWKNGSFDSYLEQNVTPFTTASGNVLLAGNSHVQVDANDEVNVRVRVNFVSGTGTISQVVDSFRASFIFWPA